MSLRDELSKHVGFNLPADFVQIVACFSEKAGNFRNGLELLEYYLDLSGGVQNSLECRYESTPVEFFPFLNTGGDGQMYGHVIHAPELDQGDYPMGTFVPGENEGIIHIGDSTRSGLENLISYIHSESGFSGIDLPWLDRLNIHPTPSKAGQVFHLTGGRYTRPTPKIPLDWEHVMTSDGVGVVAHRSQFREERVKKWSYEHPTKDFLTQADNEIEDGFLGTALYHLKQGWWMKYFLSSIDDGLKGLGDRLVFVYRKLGKDLLAQTMEQYFDWIFNTRTSM